MQQRRIPTTDFLMAWEILPSWESRPTPTCSTSSRGWGVCVGGNASVLRGRGRDQADRKVNPVTVSSIS